MTTAPNSLLRVDLNSVLISPCAHTCPVFGRYEDGQVGDANINTQDPKIQKEIMRVIGTQVYTN